MKEKILKPVIVRRVTEKLKEMRIVVGGGKEWRKRKYHLKYTQEMVNNVIMAFMDVIVDTLENGDSVKLNNYMVIEPNHRKERRGRNPYENKEIIIPERYKVKLIPGLKLEEACKRLSEKEFGEN